MLVALAEIREVKLCRPESSRNKESVEHDATIVNNLKNNLGLYIDGGK